MHLPSASKIGLAMRCSLPFHPSMKPLWSDSGNSAAAKRGNDAHDVAESHEPGADEEAEYKSARNLTDVVRVAVDELTADSWFLREQPFVYDPVTDTARLLPRTEEKRDYSQVRDGEFVGTFDLLTIRTGEITIIDHKTGRGARKESARQSWQLRMMAVAASRFFRADFVKVALVHLDEGDYRPDSFEFAAWDLDEYAGDLLALHGRIASGLVDARPGPHCFGAFCPVRTACPEQVGKLARIAEDAKKRLPVLGPIDNDEDCARWHLGIKLLEDVVTEIRGVVAEDVKVGFEAWTARKSASFSTQTGRNCSRLNFRCASRTMRASVASDRACSR